MIRDLVVNTGGVNSPVLLFKRTRESGGRTVVAEVLKGTLNVPESCFWGVAQIHYQVTHFIPVTFISWSPLRDFGLKCILYALRSTPTPLLHRTRLPPPTPPNPPRRRAFKMSRNNIYLKFSIYIVS